MAANLQPVTKVSDALKQKLNEAIAREIQVSIQYMWQHVQVVGVKGIAVQDHFKQTAIVEMKHAEAIGERLFYLGAIPTTKPDPIFVGSSLKEMLEMVKIPRVKCIKMGTRDMARWLWDYEQLKAARPELSIITCHDEYLLPTLLEAGDGALIGFAGFAPQLMIDLVHACLAGDLPRAKKAQQTVAPLARLIYNFGEPGCGAHQRMKVAKWLLGQFPSPVFRRPVRPLPETEVQRLRVGLRAIGMKPVY